MTALSYITPDITVDIDSIRERQPVFVCRQTSQVGATVQWYSISCRQHDRASYRHQQWIHFARPGMRTYKSTC